MHISPPVKEYFKGLNVSVAQLSGAMNKKTSLGLTEIANKLFPMIKLHHDLEFIEDVPQVKHYKKMMRHSVGMGAIPLIQTQLEDLIAQKPVLQGNVITDVCTTMTLKHGVLVRAYDFKKIQGKVSVRFAVKDESFTGLDGSERKLTGKEVVLSDSEKVLSIYAYEDSNAAIPSLETTEIVLVGYGTPEYDKKAVLESVEDAMKLLQKTTHCSYRGMVCID